MMSIAAPGNREHKRLLFHSNEFRSFQKASPRNKVCLRGQIVCAIQRLLVVSGEVLSIVLLWQVLQPKMDFELFIKDNCFLPETVDIKVNSTLIFKNTDSIQHTIRCKGSASFPEFVLEAGRSSKFKFDKPGRYEISEADIGDMKVTTILSHLPRLASHQLCIVLCSALWRQRNKRTKTFQSETTSRPARRRNFSQSRNF